MEAQNEKKVTAKALMEEIAILVKDEIVATFTQEKSALRIQLHNGQSFLVEVKELCE